MQRKRTMYRDIGNVESGIVHPLVPVQQMKRFALKNLFRAAIVAIIVYVVYSIYHKMHMVKPVFQESLLSDKQSVNDISGDEAKQARDNWKENMDAQPNREKPRESQQLEKDRQSQLDTLEENLHKENLVKEVKRQQVLADDSARNVRDEAKVKHLEAENKRAVEELEAESKLPAEDLKVDNKLSVEDLAVEDELPVEDLEVELEEKIADTLKDAVHDIAEEQRKDHHLDEGKVGEDPNAANQDEQDEKSSDEEQDQADKKEFDAVVQNVEKELRGDKIEELRLRSHNLQLPAVDDSDHKLPPFVTAASQDTYTAINHLIHTMQETLPGRILYVYDLDLTVTQKKKLMATCNVEVKPFMKGLFPNFVSSLRNYHWRPLVIQTALAAFGHVTWINPGYELASNNFAHIIHESHKHGAIMIGSTASFSTNAVTHPDMYAFIKTDAKKAKATKHIEVVALMIHNTENVQEKFMKYLTACALEEKCLAPRGSKWEGCRFDFTGTQYARCHRYDEAAINILLKNMYAYDPFKFSKRNTVFKPVDTKRSLKVKYCKDYLAINIDDHEAYNGRDL